MSLEVSVESVGTVAGAQAGVPKDDNKTEMKMQTRKSKLKIYQQFQNSSMHLQPILVL